MSGILSPSNAARALGVSAKALRLYETHGLLTPSRTAAGYRAYDPATMSRAAQIVALRKLGLGLSEIRRLAAATTSDLDAALATHQRALEDRTRDLAGLVESVRRRRAGLKPPAAAAITFSLPWPWAGEPLKLPPPCPITYLVGPLGSGKTRLAEAIAKAIPGACFIGLHRTPEPAIADRVAGLSAEGATAIVVDMVEQGLGHRAQQALIARLRHPARAQPPLFLMTRSTAILDLAVLPAGEAILYCPANHSPPFQVFPHPGALGYESVADCLATPEVRARTAGIVALRPQNAC